MDAPPQPLPLARRNPAAFFLLANLGYMLAVHAPAFYRWPDRWQMLAPNLALLYLCIVAVFFLTRLTVQGPWWLGSLAGATLMANPLKMDAVLQDDGSFALLSHAAALGSLACYAAWRRTGLRPWAVPFLVLFVAATHLQQLYLGLLLAVLLWEWLVGPDQRKPWLILGLLALIQMEIIYYHFGVYEDLRKAPADIFGPLALVLYPIGFLPHNALRAYEFPLLTLACAAGATGLFFLMYRKARQPALLFAAGAALATRLFQPGSVDLVTMERGGGMTGIIAFMMVGVAALCYRMQQHPKWRKPVVFITTLWCVVLFGLQVRAILHWDSIP